jgi:ribokinase
MDLVIKTAKIPNQGETVIGSDFITNTGGKGANQAVAAAKMGVKTYMIGSVGKAFGHELIKTLEQEKVNTDFVKFEKDVSSGIAVIIIHDYDNRIILDKGANALISVQDIEKAFALAKREDILIVQHEIETDIVYYALKKAKQLGMITVFNPAPAKPLNDSIYRNIDFFIPNQTETLYYTKIFPKDINDARSAASLLLNKGVGHVLITMGEKGSYFLDRENEILVKAVKVDVVDTTAAGDAYIGAFVASLAKSYSILESMNISSIASALTVSKHGAQQSLPSLEEVESMMKGLE